MTIRCTECGRVWTYDDRRPPDPEQVSGLLSAHRTLEHAVP